jgi:hypothetical protein
MDYDNRRARLPKGRRINLNVNLDPEIHSALGLLCGGNKSAAIETLVRQHLERLKTPTTEPA